MQPVRSITAPTLQRAGAILLAIVVAVTLGACDRKEGATAPAGKKTFQVAHFAASSQNGFNQAIYQGMQKRAGELQAQGVADFKLEILDGKFDAQHQYNQVQDAATAKKYDAFVVTPNDSVSLAAAVQTATTTGTPVVTTLFPLGSELDKLEPQVPELTATVAIRPTVGATAEAERVAAWCQTRDPCNVVILIGQLRFPFDNVRYKAFRTVLAKHPNIKVVATAEGNYDRDQSLKAMQDVLQAHRDVHAVLSNADQHVFGAEIAIQDAGLDPRAMYLIGGGGSTEAIARVRDGRWDADLNDFPVTMGYRAMEQLVNKLLGKPVRQVIDMSQDTPVPLVVDAETLKRYPEYQGEWTG